LNDVKVSKGVLGCLDTGHHPDEGQFLTTTCTITKPNAKQVYPWFKISVSVFLVSILPILSIHIRRPYRQPIL